MTEPLLEYGRVRVWPGKHGPDDYRVTFAGYAPTHGELITMLAAVLRAERRYNKPSDLGPYMLWSCIERKDPLFAKTWEEMRAMARGLDEDKELMRPSTV